MSSQLRDIVKRSAEMMNIILDTNLPGQAREALAWNVRAEVLELQRLQKRQYSSSTPSRFNYSIFVSQSYDDDWTIPVRASATRCLESNGIRPIIAAKEVVAGPSIIAKVLEMIEASEGLLCILTPSKSDPQVPSSWQITEIALAVACRKPIGFLVEDSVKQWAQTYYGALYNLIGCTNGERLIHVIDSKIEETMSALEKEICSRHSELLGIYLPTGRLLT